MMFVKHFADALYKHVSKLALAALALVTFFNLALVGNAQSAGDLRYADDGYVYAWNGSTWNLTGLSNRTFPDPNNNAVYDLYVNGVLTEHWDFSYRPGYAGIYTHATGIWQQYPMTSAYGPYRVYGLDTTKGIVGDLGNTLIELTTVLNQLQAAIAQQNAAMAQQNASTNSSNPGLDEAEKAQLAAMRQRVLDTQNRMAEIWTRPACTASYNGC